MKCPNCGAEVHEEDKFCGECGKPLRHEIKIAPIWKWGSMVASLVLVLIYWILCIGITLYTHLAVLIILLIFGLPSTIYLMYKERTEKIKYGLAWISFPILTFPFTLQPYPEDAFEVFLSFVIPAIIIDVIFMLSMFTKQDKRK